MTGLFVVLALCLAGLNARAEAQNTEQRLRERAEGLYSALMNSQWKKVESFLNEDAKVIWAQQKKNTLMSYKLESAEVKPGGKEAVTDVLIEFPVELVGGRPMKMNQKLEWVWENDDWYVVLRKRLPVIDPPKPPPPPNVQPELKFESEIFDFRLLRRGEPIRARFSFTNKSDHTVRVRPAAANPCNCISFKLSKNEFKPGESGALDVTMETAEFGGYFIQGVDVNLEPSGAKVVLAMQGNILLPGQKGK